MGRIRSIAQINAALIGLYFVPAWGHDAIRVLRSPVYGLDDLNYLAAAAFYRHLFEFNDLARPAAALAAMKLVVTSMFVAYLIDFLRCLAVKRSPDRATMDAALFFAAAGIVLFAVPAYATGNGELIRLHATQFLMVAGAVFVVFVERICERPVVASPSVTWEPPPEPILPFPPVHWPVRWHAARMELEDEHHKV